jgi:hypothetical protein
VRVADDGPLVGCFGVPAGTSHTLGGSPLGGQRRPQGEDADRQGQETSVQRYGQAPFRRWEKT